MTSVLGNHQFANIIETNLCGEQEVYLYAINVAGGNSVLIGSGKAIVEHTYNVVVKKATCTEEGQKSLVCSACGLIKEGSIEVIPKIEHIWKENYTVDKEATCKKEGQKSIHCSLCDAIKENSVEIISVIEHSWNNGSVTKNPTCTEKGLKTYTCTGCETTKTEDIPATGHQHTELRNTKEATCIEEGYTGDIYCKDCNEKLSSGETIAETGHSWDEGKTTAEATCTDDGVKTYSCYICGETKTERIPHSGHIGTIETRNAVSVTCTKDGYTGDKYCSACNQIVETGKVVPKTDHMWNAGIITTEPTCSSDGIRTYTCSICHDTKTETVTSTGHL